MEACVNVKQLNNTVMSISQQVTEILTKEQDHDTSPVEVGNWVLRKVNKLNWSSPLWTGRRSYITLCKGMVDREQTE